VSCWPTFSRVDPPYKDDLENSEQNTDLMRDPEICFTLVFAEGPHLWAFGHRSTHGKENSAEIQTTFVQSKSCFPG